MPWTSQREFIFAESIDREHAKKFRDFVPLVQGRT